MASGNIVGILHRILPPGTNFGTLDVRVGGSTPAENVLVVDLDDSSIEYVDYLYQLYGYAGGGLTVDHEVMMTSATVNELILSDAIRRWQRSGDDLDASHTYDFNNSSAVTVPGTAGQPFNVSVTFSDGADMDSLADGEYFILRTRRFATDASDDASGDAELIAPLIKET